MQQERRTVGSKDGDEKLGLDGFGTVTEVDTRDFVDRSPPKRLKRVAEQSERSFVSARPVEIGTGAFISVTYVARITESPQPNLAGGYRATHLDAHSRSWQATMCMIVNVGTTTWGVGDVKAPLGLRYER